MSRLSNISIISFGIKYKVNPVAQKNSSKIKIFWANKTKWDLKKFKKLIKIKQFISFDVDGLDSSIMQATGTPEPGGLFWDETLEIIKCYKKFKNCWR